MANSGRNIRSLAFARRAVGYFAAWIVLIGGVGGADSVVGAIAALAAARLSLELRPPRAESVRYLSLARFAARFLRDSLVAGIDVARRAFSPSLPLRTGFVSYSPATPAGDSRALFTDITCLMPGSVPLGTDATGAVVYHCLDMDQPVAAQLAEQEALFRRALGLDIARPLA